MYLIESMQSKNLLNKKQHVNTRSLKNRRIIFLREIQLFKYKYDLFNQIIYLFNKEGINMQAGPETDEQLPTFLPVEYQEIFLIIKKFQKQWIKILNRLPILTIMNVHQQKQKVQQPLACAQATSYQKQKKKSSMSEKLGLLARTLQSNDEKIQKLRNKNKELKYRIYFLKKKASKCVDSADITPIMQNVLKNQKCQDRIIRLLDSIKQKADDISAQEPNQKNISDQEAQSKNKKNCRQNEEILQKKVEKLERKTQQMFDELSTIIQIDEKIQTPAAQQPQK